MDDAAHKDSLSVYVVKLFCVPILLLFGVRQLATSMEDRYVPPLERDYRSPRSELQIGSSLDFDWTKKLKTPCVVIFATSCGSCSIFGPEIFSSNKAGLPIYFATPDPPVQQPALLNKGITLLRFGSKEEQAFQLWRLPRAFVLDRDRHLVRVSSADADQADLARFVRDVEP